jgi:micrococcal nuclease
MSSSPFARPARLLFALALVLACTAPATAQAPPVPARAGEAPSAPRGEVKPQTRPHGTRVAVDGAKLRVSDGDTVVLDWGAGGRETVRILGIDTPEIAHPRSRRRAASSCCARPRPTRTAARSATSS